MGVMVLTLFITSCNKYSNDFQALKDQISALSLKVDGVVALQSQLTATTAQISALQTAVAGLPGKADLASSLTGVNDQLTALSTALADLATKGATAASVAKLQADLTAAMGKSDSTTNAKIAAVLTQLGVVATGVTANGTSTAALQTSVDALKLMYSTTSAQLQIIMNALGMYTGDVTILTDQDANFYYAKLFQMGIVDGNVTVNTDALSDSGVFKAKAVLHKLTAVIGNNSATTTITTVTTTDHHRNHNNQVVVSSITTTPGTGHSVWINNAGASDVVTTSLVSVPGNYKVSGYDIDDSKLTTVGGNVVLHYPGDFASASLTLVGGNLILVDAPYAVADSTFNDATGMWESAPDVSVAGTGNISFPAVNVEGFVGQSESVAPNGTVDFSAPATKSIVFFLADNAAILNLNADVATTVQIWTKTIPLVGGLTITAEKATSVVLAATEAKGVISVWTKSNTAVSMAKLDKSDHAINVTINSGSDAADGSVDLSLLAAAPSVTIEGILTIAIPFWTKGLLTSSSATTVTLMKHEWNVAPVLPAVVTLTIGNLNNVAILLDASYPKLVTAWFNGKTQTHWVDCVASVVSDDNLKLATLKITGVLNALTLDGDNGAFPKLVTLSTAGQINKVTLNNVDVLKNGLTLGHANFQGDAGYGGPGSKLIVTNNDKLTSVVTTALDKLLTLTVTGNPLVASFDFSSFKNVISQTISGLTTPITINIDAQGVMAVFTAGSTGTPEADPLYPIIKNASIATLKSYVAALYAAAATVGDTGPTINPIILSINTAARDGITADTLATLMNANSAPWAIGTNPISAGGGITSASEMAIVIP